MSREPLRFPHGFLWGTATSSHQVEGCNTNNQWWDWEQQPGRIWRGDTSGVACGWWEDAEHDLDRAVALGQNAHRMSVEWSRIEPRDGEFDPQAIRRYREIVTAIRSRGMEPMITLHHFTNPRWLEAQGSWRNPATPQRFARFVRYTVEALGDLCDLWCTINEPTVYTVMGHSIGYWPPGRRSLIESIRVIRTLLRGHHLATDIIHRLSPANRVGIVHHKRIYDPATPGKRDVAVSILYNFFANGIVLRALGQSCDFFGLNYYSRDHLAFDVSAPHTLFGRRFTPPHFAQSDLGALGEAFGEIYPDGIYRALRRIHRRLRLPIYVTETGLPDEEDKQRPHFILDHLAAVHRAIHEGVDVRGVFLWSLVDNFEWAEGWGQRFGLYALDRVTGERRLRPSGALYAAIARANAIPAPGAL